MRVYILILDYKPHLHLHLLRTIEFTKLMKRFRAVLNAYMLKYNQNAIHQRIWGLFIILTQFHKICTQVHIIHKGWQRVSQLYFTYTCGKWTKVWRTKPQRKKPWKILLLGHKPGINFKQGGHNPRVGNPEKLSYDKAQKKFKHDFNLFHT